MITWILKRLYKMQNLDYSDENNLNMPDKTQRMHFIIFNAFLSNFVVIHFSAKKSNFLIQAKIYKNIYSIPIDEKGPVRPFNWALVWKLYFDEVYKTATCHTSALILLFIFFVVLIVLSSLGNAIIIVILYPQICGSTKSRTARHFKIKISLAVSGAV